MHLRRNLPNGFYVYFARINVRRDRININFTAPVGRNMITKFYKSIVSFMTKIVVYMRPSVL